MHLTGRNPHTAQHLPTIAHPRAGWLVLRKAFKNLDTDFLRDRTLDLAHAIPEPDYFPLLLDIHWSPPRNDQYKNITGTILQATARELETYTQNFHSAVLHCARFWLRGSYLLRRLRSLCRLRRLGTLIVAGNHHGPIHAAGLRTFHAGDTDASRPRQQQIFSVPRRIDPLVEGFGKAVVAVRNVLRGPAGARRIDARIEPAEDIVIQLVLGGHRLGLVVCNPRQSRVQSHALLPVLQPKVRNHLRGIGRRRPAQDCGGKTKRQPQQKSLPRQKGRLPAHHTYSPAPSQLGPLGRFNPKKTQ